MSLEFQRALAMALCPLIVGYLCVVLTNVGLGNGLETSATVTADGLAGGAEIRASGWKVNFVLHADLVLTLNPQRLTQVCAGTHCLSYYRKCDVADQPTRCDYSILARGVPADPIRIEGQDAGSMRSAIERLSIILDEFDGVTIPFTELNEESIGPSPYCHYRRLPGNRFDVEPGCPLPN